MAAKKIDVVNARRAVVQGSALLVCAYDDAERTEKFRLSESLSLKQFEARTTTLPKDHQIIFYCA